MAADAKETCFLIRRRRPLLALAIPARMADPDFGAKRRPASDPQPNPIK